MNIKRYAVIGHPVSHSLSPYIHKCFASQFGITLNYTTIDVIADRFEESVTNFFLSAQGLNVTSPFKLCAWKMAQQCTERAAYAQSANTLWKDSNDQLCADNTDGIGLVADLNKNMGFDIKGCRILISGAGGAVRGIIKPLLDAQPEMIALTNRTQEKANLLAETFRSQGPVCTLTEQPAKDPFDLVINATSAGFTGKLPPIPPPLISKTTVVYDLSYGKASDNFLQWSKNLKPKQVSDGMGMLVEQAAEAFYIWHGFRPQTVEIIKTLRNEL